MILARTVFYPMGGGQPGDTGSIEWQGGHSKILDTRYGDDGSILHLLEEGVELPTTGTAVSGEFGVVV